MAMRILWPNLPARLVPVATEAVGSGFELEFREKFEDVSDEQWAKVEPHLPINQREPERHDDRRILSGIMHVQRSGCRWKDCPSEYGPHKTIYNRFARWSERGIWQNLMAAVAGERDTPEQVALDSSHVKIHRCASGGKGGSRYRR